MQIQRVQNNQTSFQARLSIKDAGNSLSMHQKSKLKQFAQKIGEDTDRIFIGTRKYDNIDNVTEKHFKRKDGIVLSLVDNKIVDMRFNSENMFENIAQYLKTFTNEGHNYSKIKPQNVSEAILDMKDQINEFCSLKRTYYKKSIGEIIKDMFTSTEKIKVKANKEEDFQEWLRNERIKKETQEDVDLLEGFYDTFIRPVKEELYG